MKTKVFFTAIVVLFATTIFSASAQTNPKYFFDRKYENGKVLSSTKYELNYSGLHVQTNLSSYSYDEQGNLVKKEDFKWNPETSAWIPVYYIEFSYDILTNSRILEYATWNKKENKFNPVSEKVIYQMDALGTVASAVFKKIINPKTNTFEELTAFASEKEYVYLAM
jgi:hypothetical protein